MADRRRHRRYAARVVALGVTSLALALAPSLTPTARAAKPHPHRARPGEKRLVAAAKRGDVKALRKLVAAGADASARDRRHRTLLHIAAGRGDLALARYLLSLKAVKVNAVSRYTGLAIHEAAGAGKVALLELLLKRGASLEGRDHGGMTPLLVAALSGRAQALRTLVARGAKLGARSRRGIRVADAAAMSGSVALVKLLRSKGVELGAKGWRGKLPLHIAAERGHAALLRYLIRARAGQVDALDAWGYTPLLLAAGAGKLACVKLLARAGAKLDARGSVGWTPLHNALYYKHAKVARWLVGRKGVDIDARVTKGVDCKGCQPIHIALQKKLRGVAWALLRKGAKLDGVIHGRYWKGYDAFRLAAAQGYCKLASAMWKRRPKMPVTSKTVSSVYFTCKALIRRLEGKRGKP